MAAQRYRTPKRHAILDDAVFAHLDMRAAEVSPAAVALHLEHADADFDSAGAPLAAIALQGGLLVDEVRRDVQLLRHADLACADLGAVGQALAVLVTEATAAPYADAHRTVLAA